MKLSILGREIPVVFCSQVTLDEVSEDADSIGYFDGNAIYIKQSLPAGQKQRVLKHEIVHAMLNISGLTHLLKADIEEAICDLMENVPDAHV